jgi:hypothetical protein
MKKWRVLLVHLLKVCILVHVVTRSRHPYGVTGARNDSSRDDYYMNITVIATDVRNVNRIAVVDTSYDTTTTMDIITAGMWRLSSIRQKRTTNTNKNSNDTTSTTTQSSSWERPINYGKYIRGVEAVDVFREKENTNVAFMTVACSNFGLKSNQTKKVTITGAIQLVKETSSGIPDIRTLIKTTIFTSATKTLFEVNGHDIKVVDVNQDGHSDFIATISGTSFNKTSNNKTNSNYNMSQTTKQSNGGCLLYWKNDQRNNFQMYILEENLNGIALLGTGDFDQNGRIDIVVLAVERQKLLIYYQQSDGTFTRDVIGTSLLSV